MTPPLQTLRRYLRRNSKASQVLKSLAVINNSAVFSAGRSLRQSEIETLEKNGNRARKWSSVTVHPRFSAENIFDCEFLGKVFLGIRDEVIKSPLGLALLPGIKRSRIKNAVIQNAVIQNAAFISNYYIDTGSCILNTGFLLGSTKNSFGIGEPIHPGSELRNRCVWALESGTAEYADWASRLIPKNRIHVEREFRNYFKQFSSPLGYVGSNSFLANNASISNTWIGPDSRIEGAVKVANCVLAGHPQNPVTLSDGAIAESCFIMEGSGITSGAMAFHTWFMGSSKASERAVVRHSILGQNSEVSKGEVTSCLLGPFVAAHHQSLLIAALWPDGKGNVAHGACVGSNHTGKKPDQEIHIGEGTFFGLACQIKFPANLMEAPYSLIASGVITSPQKITFPFSLLVPATGSGESASRQTNQILPGWMWGANPYALFRNMYKYEERNKTGSLFSSSIFTLHICELTLTALKKLRGFNGKKDAYTDRDLPEIGKNILSETHRTQAVEFYEDFLYFAVLKEQLETGKSMPPGIKKIRSLLFPNQSVKTFLRTQKYRLDQLKERMIISIERDEIRGRRIIDDYLKFQPSIRKYSGKDPVLRRFLKELKDWNRAI